jgi:hypothetical protein
MQGSPTTKTIEKKPDNASSPEHTNWDGLVSSNPKEIF